MQSSRRSVDSASASLHRASGRICRNSALFEVGKTIRLIRTGNKKGFNFRATSDMEKCSGTCKNAATRYTQFSKEKSLDFGRTSTEMDRRSLSCFYQLCILECRVCFLFKNLLPLHLSRVSPMLALNATFSLDSSTITAPNPRLIRPSISFAVITLMTHSTKP